MTLDIDPNEEFEQPKDVATEIPSPAPQVVPAEAPKAESSQQAVATRAAPSLPIEASEGGVLVGNTFEQQYRLARVYLASGMMPKAFNTEAKIVVGMQVCHELGLKPMTSISQIMIMNGTPSIFGDLPISLAFQSGKLEKYEDKEEDKDGQPYSWTFTAWRKGFGAPVSRTFTMDDARRANLLRNDVWSKYPKRMLQCRARAWVLKDLFPDALKGIAILEYDMNATVDGQGNLVGGDAPVNNVAAELNKKFLSAPTQTKEA